MECRFTVPGEPVPKGRPRVVRNKATGRVHGVTPKKTASFEGLVRLCAASARPAGWPMRCDYKVEIVAVMPRRGVDLDNAVKSLLDGCNTVLWADDAQVSAINALRILDPDKPLTEIAVTALPVRCKLKGCGHRETLYPDEDGRCENCAAKRGRAA